MNPQLLRVILVQVCLWSTIAGVRLAVPLLALQQGYGTAPVGFLLALFALTQVFLALPAGRFADRHGVRLPVMLSAIASGIGVCAAALFPVFSMLCLAALLTGGGICMTVIATQRHVGNAASGDDQRKQAFSWLAIAPALGNLIGPLCAGLLIDYAGEQPGDLLAYRTTFMVMAVFPLAGWLLLRGVHELVNDRTATKGMESPTRTWDLLQVPMFRRLLFVNWLQGVSWDLHIFAVPMLGHARGMSASTIGIIMGGFAMATMLVRLVLPWLSARFDERDIITASTLSTGMLLVVYPLMPSALLMGVCSLILGFSMGAVQPMVMALIHGITPPSRQGEALGIRLMFVMASSVAVPIVFGATSVVVGLTGIFWIIGGVVACGTSAVRGLKAGD